jgi:hypothetical protein
MHFDILFYDWRHLRLAGGQSSEAKGKCAAVMWEDDVGAAQEDMMDDGDDVPYVYALCVSVRG